MLIRTTPSALIRLLSNAAGGAGKDDDHVAGGGEVFGILGLSQIPVSKKRGVT
jgi:hypothetical protein